MKTLDQYFPIVTRPTSGDGLAKRKQDNELRQKLIDNPA